MKIHYRDEYGEDIYVAYNKNAIPRSGDIVSISNEEFRVKDVVWPAEYDYVIIIISEDVSKSIVKESVEFPDLSKIKSKILQLDKQQERQEKRNSLLNEQLISIRSRINNILRERKK